jgi:hypothetical protein
MRTFDVQRGDKFTKGDTTYLALDFECYPIIFRVRCTKCGRKEHFPPAVLTKKTFPPCPHEEAERRYQEYLKSPKAARDAAAAAAEAAQIASAMLCPHCKQPGCRPRKKGWSCQSVC